MNFLFAATAFFLLLGLLCFAGKRFGWQIKLPQSPYAQIAVCFVLLRIVLYLVPLFLRGDSFWEAISGADSEHYLRLAEFGYQPGTEHENLLVFYPLYPLLMRLLHYILPDMAVCGLLINNLCTLGACFFLYALLREDLSEKAALRGTLLFLLYPFSFFTLSIYTEGLFLLLSAGSLYFARKGRFALCGIFGLLCAFTRNQGVLLLLPAGYELIRQKAWRKLPLLALIPLGLLGYLLINQALYGDFFAFMAFQRVEPWYQTFAFFPENIEQHWSMGLAYPGLASIMYFPQIALFFLGLAAMLYGNRKKLPLSLLLYGFCYIIISYSAGWLLSGGRYMLGCLPLFAALGVFCEKDRRWAGAVLWCAGSMTFLYVQFILGYSIM